jgi:3-oxoacyl-[acyl-carrier-protein] synthase II
MAILSVWSNGNFKEISFQPPKPLHILLEEAGFYGLRPCGGLGKCGKCAVTLSGAVSDPTEAEEKAGLRLACQAEILGDAQVFLPTAANLQQIQTESEAEIPFTPADGVGIAVDIGSTTLVLETEEHLRKRGAAPYAELLGCGMAHRSVKFGTLSGSGEALEEAIATACANAGISLDQIDGIVGFANGMEAIDALELTAYRKLFGSKLASLPLFSVKTQCGESRAAAASLSAAHATLLPVGKLPEGQSAFCADESGVHPISAPQSGYQNLLVTSFAPGGSYCALILAKAD